MRRCFSLFSPKYVAKNGLFPPSMSWISRHFPQVCRTRLGCFPQVCRTWEGLFPQVCRTLFPRNPPGMSHFKGQIPQVCRAWEGYFPQVCRTEDLLNPALRQLHENVASTQRKPIHPEGNPPSMSQVTRQNSPSLSYGVRDRFLPHLWRRPPDLRATQMRLVGRKCTSLQRQNRR